MGETDGFVDWWKTYTANHGRIDLQWNVQAETAALDAWEAAIKQEREACAHVCLELASIWRGDPVLAGMSDGAEDCASAIRARREGANG